MITIVSGLPRSGTSLMMQMLAAGGVAILADGVRPPDASNPRGYCEWEKAKSLPTDPDCISEAEGKAVKIISALLPSVRDTSPCNVIFMERALAEVAASQAAMIQKLGAQSPALAPEAMERILGAHLKQVNAALRLKPALRILRIAHHDVLMDPRRVCEKLQEFLGTPLSLAAMAAQVDLSLYRQRLTRAL